MFYFSECGTCSGIVEFCVTFLCRWNTLWYCEMLCYIFPHVERALKLCNIFPHVAIALVLWNFVLYISSCGTCFVIVDFFNIFFPCVERALGLRNFVLYFSVCGMRSGIVE